MAQARSLTQNPPQSASAARSDSWGTRIKTSILGYGLILPSLLVFLTFFYGPAIFLAYIAFFHWNIFSANSTFVGLGNFLKLFHQPVFWQSLLNTAYYVVVLVPVTALLALALALLLREGLSRRGGGISRAFIFLPHVTPVVATSIIWVWIFNPQFGLANTVLHFLHLPALNWLESVHWALPSVMVYTLWHSVGLYTVLFLAGLASIPRSVIEAATTDGAHGWRMFKRVFWPMLGPITFFVVVLASINTMQTFSQIYTLTGGPHGGAGGPAFSTTTDSLLIYQTAFLYLHFSLASAMSIILFILIMTLTLIQKWVADRFVFYR
ncbi:MAG: sugar ABC transporter permease [Firmicutes bacterium]|uniref:Sugar ABC transporter permease n=1 Tax=Sulfobacillus benefaciens TaxID=453960 RepID=A0A2T2X9M3_9FIRM|nr:sugar ABC transporter permease [Bacillota bacterium]MCL5013153.1 sugar ABC transporter permease [Bacillota bacterium]PSR31146.1 MAG: sugar ABC transporter permease [Sulfobacillus benefaciens]